MTNSNHIENTLWQGKTSWLYWRRPLFTAGLLIGTGLIILTANSLPLSINTLLQDMMQSPWRIWITIGLWLVACVIAVATNIMRTRAGRFRVTTCRVIERRGLIANHTNEIQIANIRGINLRQSATQRLLNLGTLEMSSAGKSTEDVSFHCIRGPRRIRELIHSLQLVAREE